MYQMKQYFFWVSSIELLAMIVSTTQLFEFDEYAVFALYIPHFIRCYAGFYIYMMLPNSDHIMKDVKHKVDAENKLSRGIASSAK